MPTELIFEGLETLEARIRRLSTDAAFIVAWDRTDTSNEERLGRFDLLATNAALFLADKVEPELQESRSGFYDPDLTDDGEETDETDEEGFGESESDDSSPSPLAEATRRRLEARLTFAEILEAACRWLRDLASRNTLGEEFRRFRIKIYGPKGLRQLETGTFLVRNPGWKPPVLHFAAEPESMLPPPLSMPQPTFDESALTTATKSMKVLGDLYSQWGHIMLGGVNQLQGVNNSMIGKLHQQLTESRDQVDQLVASILEFRVSQLTAAEQRNVQVHQDETRTALARDALRQLGDAAKVFLSARGVTPELAEVVNTMGASPELMAALNDPDVRELLRDPNNLQLLAGLLKQFGAQSRAARTGVIPGAETAATHEAQAGAAASGPASASPAPAQKAA